MINLFVVPSTDPKPDKSKCSECGGVFNVSDCRTEYGHHDGWEMPSYTEIYCPNCEDGGCLDDFFFSGGHVMIDWFITLYKNDRCIPAGPSTRLACNPIPYLGDDYIVTGGLTSYYVPNTDIVIIITNRSLTA